MILSARGSRHTIKNNNVTLLSSDVNFLLEHTERSASLEQFAGVSTHDPFCGTILSCSTCLPADCPFPVVWLAGFKLETRKQHNCFLWDLVAGA